MKKPNISIKVNYKHFLSAIFISMGTTCVLGLGVTNVYFSMFPKISSKDPDPVKKELEFWKQVSSENPTYRDAYLYIAYLESKSGNKVASEEALNEAQKINPNK